jgi:hypothetical protein
MRGAEYSTALAGMGRQAGRQAGLCMYWETWTHAELKSMSNAMEEIGLEIFLWARDDAR